MDTAAPASMTRIDRSDLGRLAVLLFLAIVARSWVIAHTEVAARDSIGFIRFALHLEQPPTDYQNPDDVLSRREVIRRAEHAPGYPVAIWLMAHPVRAITGAELMDCDALVLTCQLVSAVSGVLIVFPIYFIGRMLYGRDLAFIACLLFQTLPVVVQVTSDGLSDGLYLLLTALTVWSATAGLRTPTAWAFLRTGIGIGATYLVRPEGLMMVIALMGTIALLRLCQRWSWRQSLVHASAVLVGVALVAVPYVVTIGKLTNKPTGGELFRWMQGEEMKPVWKSSLGSNTLFAAWHQGQQPKVVWALSALFKETLKTGHYALPFLAVIGFVMLFRRMWRDSIWWAIVSLSIVNVAVLIALATKIGYLSERHTLLIVMLGSFYAAGTIPLFGQLLSRVALVKRRDGAFWGWVTVAILVAGAVPSGLQALHANRAAHHDAGRWLAVHAENESLILDPFCWSEFYAGHAWGYGPPIPADHPGPIYVLVEPSNENPHSRLPLIAFTQVMAKAGKPVYQYPAEESEKEPQLVIYRVIPQPKRP